jgi:hypothetical protein
MRAQLEAITQKLAEEMKTTNSIMLNGEAMRKNSTNPSPYAGLCHAAVEKLAGLVKESTPSSRVDRIAFTTVNDDPWKRSRHVIAEVTTEEGNYYVDPTIMQYAPDAKMVYSGDEHYPIKHYPDSVTQSTIYDGLESNL